MKRTNLNDPALRHNPYSVPEGYFDTLTQRVMERLPEQAEATTPATTPLVPLRTKRSTRAGWTLAAAACVACALLFTHPKVSSDTSASSTLAETTVLETYDDDYREAALQYAMVDDQAIYNYLAGNY